MAWSNTVSGILLTSAATACFHRNSQTNPMHIYSEVSCYLELSPRQVWIGLQPQILISHSFLSKTKLGRAEISSSFPDFHELFGEFQGPEWCDAEDPLSLCKLICKLELLANRHLLDNSVLITTIVFYLSPYLPLPRYQPTCSQYAGICMDYFCMIISSHMNLPKCYFVQRPIPPP